MDTAKAVEAYRKYGSFVKAGRALGCCDQTVARAVRRAEDDADPKAGTDALPALRGFALRAETRVRAKRPAPTVRARFLELKRGLAYPESDVAREWGISAETLRKHARDAECFRYVETGPDAWEPCVMHPDTARLYPVK